MAKAPLGLALAAALLVALAGAVWACTPKPEAFALDTLEAAGGESVQATGTAAGGGPLQIRWNGVDGPVLAEATPQDLDRGAFSATFEVPEDAEPGVNYVVASASEANAGVARAALEVTGGEQATTASETAWEFTQDPAATTDTSALTPQGLTAPLAAGAGLLSLGLVGLFTGAAVAGVQIRRSPARAPVSRRRVG
jgi:hypothetical protein